MLEIVDEVFALEKTDVPRAGEIVRHPAALSTLDGIRIAVMERHGVRWLMSFDSDLDR